MSLLPFSLRFLGAYGVLLALVVWTPLGDAVARVVAGLGGVFLELGLGRPVEAAVAGEEILLKVPPHEGRQGVLTSLETLEHIRNIPLIVAAFLAFPRRPTLNVGLLTAAAAGAALVLDGAIVAGEAWSHNQDVLPPGALFHVYAVLGTFHTTGAAGLFAAPVFVVVLGTVLSASLARAGGSRPDDRRGRGEDASGDAGRAGAP